MKVVGAFGRCTALSVVAVFLAAASDVACAQPGDDIQSLRRAFEALSERQERLEREVEEMRRLLVKPQVSAPTEAPNRILSIDRAPSRGHPDAKLVLVEFTDYQCPFCARHARNTWPQIEREFVSRGTVLYVVRSMPLEAIHPKARKAAEASYCARDQGKYWELHHQLFANPKALEVEDLVRYARMLRLDATQFQMCLDDGQHAKQVSRDVTDGQRLGVRGTPTFFLGRRDDSDTVVVHRVLRGAVAFPAFKAAIEAVLASQ